MSASKRLLNRISLSQLGLLTLVCLLYLGIGLCYSLIVPPFETPDEIHHYAYARHLAQGNPLPVQLELSPDEIGDDIVPKAYADKLWAHEGSQAPLYYMLLAQFTSGIDQSDFEQISTFNPRANMGNPLYPGNKNIMLYSAVEYPLRGVNLAVHIGRWFSLLLGLTTLLLTYAIARMALPPPHSSTLALLAILFLATIPQFAFISAAVSNDNMIVCMSTLVLFWLARLVVKADERDITLVEWLVLGILLGLAALSKLHGLGLWLLAALVGVGIARIRSSWRVLWKAALPVVIPAVTIAGWWYWRNYLLYSDWFGLTHQLAIEGVRTSNPSIGALMSELRGMKYSFWGVFGWFNILLPFWIYHLIDFFTIAGVVGFAAHISTPILRRFNWQRFNWQSDSQKPENDQTKTRVQLLLLTWVLIISSILVYWLQRSIGSQGRLAFPAISSLMIVLVIGLNFFFERLPTFTHGSTKNRMGWLRPLLWTSLPLILVGSSIYALTTLIPQAYGAPLMVEAVPETVLEIDATYGDFEYFQILGLDIPQARYEIGDEVPVTVYMRTDETLQQDYQIFVQFLNPQGSEVANLTSHPGWGRNPTSLWKPGEIYADTYPVRVDGPIEQQSPLLARVYIGFVDPITEESGRFPVAAVDKSGRKIDPMLSAVALSSQLADSEDAAKFSDNAPQFGDVIQLSSSKFPAQIPSANRSLAVTLIWDTIGTPADEYIAYVHLLNRSGERVAGMDQPPAAGRMPTTYWQSGDRIHSGFILTLPESLPTGEYTLWSGLYEVDSQGAIRLPVTKANGHQVEHNQVLLGSIRH